MTEITKWLEGLGLECYSKSIEENDIDMEIIAELDDRELESLGVSLGHRKKILKALAENAGSATPVTRQEPSVTQTAHFDPERRHLSVMFCDLAESTRLSSIVDIEDMHEINRAYQETCALAINRYDGFVARYMGDGILAYFGYPVAHEDDAECAVQASLEITAAIKSLGRKFNLPKEIQLSARVGIATGPVVVDVIGEGPSEESAVFGEAPNRAARLQGLAKTNSVVIDPNTRQLIGQRFNLEKSGPHSLKGIEIPVMVWHVKSLSTSQGRTTSFSSSSVAMMGRDEELGLLLSRWERAREGDGQVVFLTGEAGIGKSRISQALVENIQEHRHTLLRFYCSSYHTQSPLHPFISHIEGQCDFRADDTQSDKQSKLEQVVLKNYGFSTEAFGVIASILSVELDDTYTVSEKDPVLQLTLLQQAVIENILSQASNGPVMFILEDVHWIDPTSKRCLDLLVRQVQEQCIFVLFSSRPTESFNYDQSHVTRLTLNKLNRQQVIGMIYNIAPKGGVDDAVAQIISDKSDGIPLYVEEMTRMMVQVRELNKGGKNDRDIEARVPDSLQASLLSRLDRLGSVKKIAQTAAVVGDVFNTKILAHLCNGAERKIQMLLMLLVENEIVFQHRGDFGVSYRFRHTLLRDAAYGSLLKRNRSRLHGQAAQFLVDHGRTSSVQDEELVAHHYSESGNTRKAYVHWFSAGLHALESGATREAVVLLENAKDNLPDSSIEPDDLQSMYQLHMAHGQSLVACAGAASSSAFDSFKKAEIIARQLQNIDQQVSALDYQFGMRFNAGLLNESLKIAQNMLQIGNDNDHLVARISGYQVLGMTYYVLGEFDKARLNLESALDTKGQVVTGINAYPSMTMDYLSFVLAITGQPEPAQKMCEAAYASAQTESDYSTATALSNGCLAQMFLGNFDVVRRHASDLIVFAEEKGQYMYLNRGLLYKNLSLAFVERDKQCLQYVVDAIQTLLDSSEQIETTCVLGLLAEVQISFHCYDDAESMLNQAIQIADRNEERFYQAELHRLKSELALASEMQNWSEIASIELDKARTLATSQNAKGWLVKIKQTEKKLRITQPHLRIVEQ